MVKATAKEQAHMNADQGGAPHDPHTTDRGIASIDKLLNVELEAPGLKGFLQLLHRVLVFVAAIFYFVISVQATSASVSVLRGLESQELDPTGYTAHLIVGYAGTTTISESPLVRQTLQGSTAARNDSLYLLTSTTHSFTGCTNIENFNDPIYSNEFLRTTFDAIQARATQNLTFLADLELIVPVVDCTFDLLVAGYATTASRVNYLVRRVSAPNEVLLLSTSLSIQDYEVALQYQSGVCLVVTLVAIEDMRTTEIIHHFLVALNYPYETPMNFAHFELLEVQDDDFMSFRDRPDDEESSPVTYVRTSRRLGGYIDDPISQSNLENSYFYLPSDPTTELEYWGWHSKALLRDSWGWTHSIHALFALDVMFNLSVLSFMVYRHIRRGHLWVGDAFATISNALLYRGVLVFVSNHLNGYWTLTEFCLGIGHTLTGLKREYYRPELAHADLLTFFLNLTSILSYAARERIDPLLVFSVFEIAFAYRVEMVDMYPGLRKIVVDFATADFYLGSVKVSPLLDSLSPMGFWTLHAITTDRKPLVFATVLSIFSASMLLLIYIAARKAYRYFDHPAHERATMRYRSHRYSSKEGFSMGRKMDVNGINNGSELTSFETATGAALSRRFGVISGYQNYDMRDSQRFASIDAVYGNGFVVANGKFLIATQDLFALLIMKVTRVRFTNIFVYEIVENNGINQTARLVYPQTIAWSDLARLGITRLS